MHLAKNISYSSNWGDLKSNQTLFFAERVKLEYQGEKKSSQSWVRNQQTQPTCGTQDQMKPSLCSHYWKASALTHHFVNPTKIYKTCVFETVKNGRKWDFLIHVLFPDLMANLQKVSQERNQLARERKKFKG